MFGSVYAMKIKCCLRVTIQETNPRLQAALDAQRLDLIIALAVLMNIYFENMEQCEK